MVLSVVSHVRWPIEYWDVSTALCGTLRRQRHRSRRPRDFHESSMLVEVGLVKSGVVWKIKKVFFLCQVYGLKTSPIAWKTERDNTQICENNSSKKVYGPLRGLPLASGQLLSSNPAKTLRSRVPGGNAT